MLGIRVGHKLVLTSNLQDHTFMLSRDACVLHSAVQADLGDIGDVGWSEVDPQRPFDMLASYNAVDAVCGT